MSLPIEWVEKIFKKLTIGYGVDFLNRYKGIPLVDVKTDWSEELGGFGGEAISYALDHLPDGRPPTSQQFRNLCMLCPAPELPRLAAPVVSAERINAALTPLREKLAAVAPADCREWARRLVANPERCTQTSLRMAKDALGIA